MNDTSLGERGGTTETFEEGADLIAEHKTFTIKRIRDRIEERLRTVGKFHAEDLLDLDLTAGDRRGAVGAVINGFVRRKEMVAGEVRRATGATAGHGRRSPEYVITAVGRQAYCNTDGQVGDGGSGGVQSRPAAAISSPALDPAEVRRWTSRIRWVVAESLVFTEQFQSADLDDLCVPELFRHLIDEAIATAVRRGVMVADGTRYQITDHGKAILTPLVRNEAEEVEENQEPEVAELPLGLPPATGRTLGHHQYESKAA